MDDKLAYLIDTLQEIATLLEIAGENPFKVRAYQNAARALETNSDSFEERLKADELTEIKGIGSGIADKIKEFYKSDKIELHEELKERIPEGILDILKIQGLGPKKVQVLYKKLGIDSLEKLERACRELKIRGLDGFGKKTEANILKGITAVQATADRFLLVDCHSVAERLITKIKALKGFSQIEIGGSVRRRVETVHDIDILVARDASKEGQHLADSIADLFDHESIIAHGETKVSVKLERGPSVDFRIVSEAEFPYALNYFTGSKTHNTHLRSLAKDQKLKLNEYGLFRGKKNIPCKTENDIYEALGLAYVPPPMREDMGEIEAARSDKLPRLIAATDLQGILHVHTTYSDGLNSLVELADATRAMGLHYLGIADHSRSAHYAQGLSAETVRRQHKEIDALNEKHPEFKIFKGIESDLLADGALDYEDDTLKTFDFIIGSVHSRFNLDKDAQTKRIIKAIENPYLTILGHMTGRLLLTRAGYELDTDKVIDAAVANHVIIEFNCNPQRFDIDWRVLRKAKDKGLMTSINPDAHTISGLRDIAWGVEVIQKAWVEKQSVLNTRSTDEMERLFANKQSRKRRP